MTTRYLLGIDGGGSKTEFLLTDLDLNPVKTFTVEKGSNPWHGSLEQTLDVLKEGLKQFDSADLQNVSIAYAGISGCFGPSSIKGQIQDCLHEYVKKADIGGDLESSFYAQASGKAGLLALAGSGSVIAHFKEDGSVIFYDGVGYGGRECGYILYRMLELGHIPKDSSLGTFVTNYLDKNNLVFENQENILQKANDPRMMKLSLALSSISPKSETLKELKPYLDLIVMRWSYKLCAIADKYRYGIENDWELVLAGGFWNYDYIRNAVMSELKDNLKKIHVLHSPTIRPIQGCIKIAKRMHDEEKNIV